jgi:hypothetical protein
MEQENADHPDLVLRTAQAIAGLEHAVNTLDGVLAGAHDDLALAGEEPRRSVTAFLGAVRSIVRHPLRPAGSLGRHAARLNRRTTAVEEGLRGSMAAPPADRAAGALLAMQEALALAWEGIEHGLLPGYLDRAVRSQGQGLVALTRAFLVRHAPTCASTVGPAFA